MKKKSNKMKCLKEEVIRPLVEPVSADTTDASLSFNEFLKVFIVVDIIFSLHHYDLYLKITVLFQLVAMKRREAPNEENLLAVFKLVLIIL